MLTNVSWKEYLTGLVVIVVVYYLIIGFKYYRKEINSFLKGKLPTPGSKTNKLNDSDNDTSSFDELEAIVNDLRYAILERAGKGADKTALLKQLQDRLANYSGLRKPAYRVAINNYIVTNAADICGVVFSERELNEAWDSLPR